MNVIKKNMEFSYSIKIQIYVFFVLVIEYDGYDDKSEECLCEILQNLTVKHANTDRATLYAFWYILIAHDVRITFKDYNDNDNDVSTNKSENYYAEHVISSKINTLDNELATENGYYVFHKNSTLAYDALALKQFINSHNIKYYDFGITCVFMIFSYYAAQYQYPIMAYNLKFIKEFEIVEKLLLNFLKSLKIKNNIATESGFNLIHNKHKYVGINYIKLHELTQFQDVLKNNPDTNVFIELIKHYHISIIQTFYAFSSCYGRSKFAILDCRELTKNAFNFTFPKHNIVDVYSGDYWFPVPKHPVWFAYKNKKCVFKSFIGRDVDAIVQREFDNLPVSHELIYGFITQDNYIYPIVFYDPRLDTWASIIMFIQQHKLNNAFRSNDDAMFNKVPLTCIHFVTNRYNREIYKLINSKK